MTDSARLTYVICVDNEGYEVDLDLFKVYPVVKPLPGDELMQGAIRIIDNSGEDYLYEANRFVPVELPAAVEEAIAAHLT